jgi:beta-carotene hydroxylase
MIAARFFYHEIFFFKRQLWRKYELLEWFLSRLFVATIVIVACQFGFIGYVMNFWFVPALVVGIALGLFFDYLPHRPFQERNRWKNARVYPSPLLNLLILGQNYHLVHHLWPSIPWYRIPTGIYATKPLLDAKDCEQSLGLLQGKNFWSFLYDVFLGFAFTPILLNLAHSIYRNGEVQGFRFGESVVDFMRNSVSVLVSLST